MRPRFWFWAYNNGSGSANQLIEALNGRLIRHERSKYRQRYSDIVVNWGSGHPPPNVRVSLNQPQAVVLAIHKMGTFNHLRAAGIPVPEFTQNIVTAREWNGTSRILGRDSNTGRSGHGITVYDRGSVPQIRQHLFYVKYWRKQREFRIHVFNGRVIFEQEKLQKNGAREEAGYSKYIRSHLRGWCFAFNHLR